MKADKFAFLGGVSIRKWSIIVLTSHFHKKVRAIRLLVPNT